jgi:chromosome segregation ATPase
LQELQAQLATVNGNITTCYNQIEQLGVLIQQYTGYEQAAIAYVNEHSPTLGQLQAEINSYNNSATAKAAEKAALWSQRDVVSAAISQLQWDLDMALMYLDEKANEYASAVNHYNDVWNDYSMSIASWADLEQAYTQMQQAHAQYESARASVQTINSEIAAQTTQYNQLSNQIQACEDFISFYNSLAAQAGIDYQNLSQAINDAYNNAANYGAIRAGYYSDRAVEMQYMGMLLDERARLENAIANYGNP